MMKADLKDLTQLTDNLRQLILTATTHAGSGHPTSSLSAVELMAALFFGGTFRYDINHPKCPENDRLIFSKMQPPSSMPCGPSPVCLAKRW